MCLKVISFLPFCFLYRLSDLLYFLMKDIFRYREKVIISNLKNSFPQKSESEINEIKKKFYSHLCDMLVEGVKVFSIQKQNLEKRIVFKNLDIFDNYYNQGKSIITVGMHYNNWEWVSLICDKIKFEYLVIYFPARGNKAFENFLKSKRGRYGARMISIAYSVRAVIEFSKLLKPQIIGLMADQAPPDAKYWIRFLNQETAFYQGPEKIAIKTLQPIVFEHVKKVGRGRYEVYHYPLFENYDGVESKDILIKYAHKMEEIINENPEYYLWSHRRWKHKRPENVLLMET